jgi:hypothetical protein
MVLRQFFGGVGICMFLLSCDPGGEAALLGKRVEDAEEIHQASSDDGDDGDCDGGGDGSTYKSAPSDSCNRTPYAGRFWYELHCDCQQTVMSCAEDGCGDCDDPQNRHCGGADHGP